MLSIKEGIVMKALYLNNFRNFHNELIGLEEVNFFVGENSTGKSSVLALLNLLGSVGFWLSQNVDFNSREFEFGYYDEIADSGKNNGLFNIGVFFGTESSSLVCVDMQFGKSSLGLPSIRQYRYVEKGIEKNYEFRLESVLRNIKGSYKVINLPKRIDNKWFGNWIRNDDNEYSNKISIEFMRPMPFLFWRDQINHELIKSDKQNSMQKDLDIWDDSTCWMAPIRTKAQRVYSLEKAFTPEGDHSPYALRRLLKKASRRQKLIDYGNKSNLFDSISINNLGKGSDAPFEINLLMEGKTIKLSNSGYGVSQILPIVTELLRSNRGGHYLLQQPEVHLHPRAQAEFGQLLHSLYSSESKKFTIETHSDFIIDRFRLSQKEEPCKDFSAQVLYFQRTHKTNKTYSIKINKNGSYSSKMPQQFRQFFINESIRMLEV